MTVAGWQPIETAPRDGTKILLFFPTYPSPHQYMLGSYEKISRYRNGVLEYEAEGWEHGLALMAGVIPSPTHWMPLPESPMVEAAGG